MSATDTANRPREGSARGAANPPGAAAPAGGPGGITLVMRGGCFWGLEYALSVIPGAKAVPGYAYGHRTGKNNDGTPRTIKPNFYNLGDSGDTEAVRVTVANQAQLRAAIEKLAAHSASDPAPDDTTRYARGISCVDKAMAPHVEKAMREVGLRWKLGTGDGDFVEAEKRHHGHYLKLYGPPDT